jgi:ribosomal protein L2
MTSRRDWVVLSLGLIVGAGAASLCWHGSEKRNQFIFDHNLKCQQIAKQFESENRAAVLKVSYSPTRSSCVAEVARPNSGGVDYIVQDLLSGDTIFYKRSPAREILDNQTLKDQDAKFAAASQ